MTPAARKTFIGSFLGWSLDAFDFFLLTFVIGRIATSFGQAVPQVALALTLTLACRPIGALLFGWLADRYGRRTQLMIDIAFYSLLELLTAFSPNFTVFLVLRALFGIAMGGEWGLGAAMVMEVLPPQRRGFFSGLLQQGYMWGYLLAAFAYFLVFNFTHWDWRGLFVIGALPAGLILYIRSSVPESPVWLEARARRVTMQKDFALQSLRGYWPLFIYCVAFMAALNAMSHGTQDLYATFLQKQHGFSTGQTSTLSIVAAVGAIVGGVTFGTLSQRFGRRPVVMFCALLAACMIPLWAFSPTIALLAAGAFAMQFAVQGTWGVIPAHLNELSPPEVRATFTGFTYQLGNLVVAGIAQLEASLAQHSSYSAAMALVIVVVLAAVFGLSALGYLIRPENRTTALAS
ncbi:MAG TPA: MFS transporter [Candidatus Cybelea sp.]|nr:MFS transporter [Candidatus Cybelea sp.]